MHNARYIELATATATRADDRRAHRLGAVGLRADGVLVHARNGPCAERMPQAHAEARLARKLDVGAQVWVVRVARCDGSLALARPCAGCLHILRAVGVQSVTYSTADGFERVRLDRPGVLR